MTFKNKFTESNEFYSALEKLIAYIYGYMCIYVDTSLQMATTINV